MVSPIFPAAKRSHHQKKQNMSSNHRKHHRSQQSSSRNKIKKALHMMYHPRPQVEVNDDLDQKRHSFVSDFNRQDANYMSA